MLSYISEKLKSLTGYVGYIEVDHDLRLMENTTLHGDDKANHVAGLFISFIQAYQTAGREVKTISLVCGFYVYVGVCLPTGFLIVQMSREQNLLGVRRALATIIADGVQMVVHKAPVAPPIKAAVAVLPEEQLHVPMVNVAAAEVPLWPEFRMDFLKLLSPIAPENISVRLMGNAFKKLGIPVGGQPMNLQIHVVVEKTLEEIPNPARRKVASADAGKLLAKYGLSDF